MNSEDQGFYDNAGRLIRKGDDVVYLKAKVGPRYVVKVLSISDPDETALIEFESGDTARVEQSMLFATARPHLPANEHIADSWTRVDAYLRHAILEPMSKDNMLLLAFACEQATEGPWYDITFDGNIIAGKEQPEDTRYDVIVSCTWPDVISVAGMDRALTATLEEREANAKFIALARDAVPRLIAEVIEWRRKNAGR